MTAAPAEARGRRRLAAQVAKPQLLPARIDVLGINHTVTASREFGMFYRCGTNEALAVRRTAAHL